MIWEGNLALSFLRHTSVIHCLLIVNTTIFPSALESKQVWTPPPYCLLWVTRIAYCGQRWWVHGCHVCVPCHVLLMLSQQLAPSWFSQLCWRGRIIYPGKQTCSFILIHLPWDERDSWNYASTELFMISHFIGIFLFTLLSDCENK